MTKTDIAIWGGYIVGGIGIIGTIWNRLALKFLHAQWNGFKLDYDKALRAQSRAEGELAGRDYEHTQARDEKEQSRKK